jgi:hypothetical protein
MSSAPRQASSKPIRARDYLMLFLLGGLIFLVFLKIAFVVEDKWGHDAFIRWDGLVGFTLGMFVLFVAKSEKDLRKSRFWLLTAILLAAHLTGFAIVLTHFEEWRLPWFMVMAFEYPFFLILRNRFV